MSTINVTIEYSDTGVAAATATGLESIAAAEAVIRNEVGSWTHDHTVTKDEVASTTDKYGAMIYDVTDAAGKVVATAYIDIHPNPSL